MIPEPAGDDWKAWARAVKKELDGVGSNDAGPQGDVGEIVICGSTLLPENFLECSGGEVPQKAHPSLFAAIGTRFNTSTTPSTHFRLPDLNKFAPAGTVFIIRAAGKKSGRSAVTPVGALPGFGSGAEPDPAPSTIPESVEQDFILSGEFTLKGQFFQQFTIEGTDHPQTVQTFSDGGASGLVIYQRGMFNKTSAVPLGTWLGGSVFGGFDGLAFQNTALLVAQTVEDFSSAALGTKMLLQVTPAGTTTRVTAMQWLDSGVCYCQLDCKWHQFLGPF